MGWWRAISLRRLLGDEEGWESTECQWSRKSNYQNEAIPQSTFLGGIRYLLDPTEKHEEKCGLQIFRFDWFHGQDCSGMLAKDGLEMG